MNDLVPRSFLDDEAQGQLWGNICECIVTFDAEALQIETCSNPDDRIINSRMTFSMAGDRPSC
jgi:hypothetical protein